MSTIRELLFFVCAVGAYVAIFQTTAMWSEKTTLDVKYVLAISGLVYVLLLAGLFVLFGLKASVCSSASPIILNEKFSSIEESFSPSPPIDPTGADEPMDGQAIPENSAINMCTQNIPLTEDLMSQNVVSDEAMCKGGEYMWQGDSPIAKRCRELAKTRNGRCAIGKYNCPTGYDGKPQKLFEYTSQSNDQWKNTQCQEIGKHQIDGNRECTLCTMHY